jgi:FAD/FMN-containing dehydrogenase
VSRRYYARAAVEFLTGASAFAFRFSRHPQITVGGCIAGNIHGKTKFRAKGCSAIMSAAYDCFIRRADRPFTAQNAELFELTVGGFGLTGFIVSAGCPLAPLPSPPCW